MIGKSLAAQLRQALRHGAHMLQCLVLWVLMHASFTGGLLTLFPAMSLKQGIVWKAALAAVLWFVVVVIGFFTSPEAQVTAVAVG